MYMEQGYKSYMNYILKCNIFLIVYLLSQCKLTDIILSIDQYDIIKTTIQDSDTTLLLE